MKSDSNHIGGGLKCDSNQIFAKQDSLAAQIGFQIVFYITLNTTITSKPVTETLHPSLHSEAGCDYSTEHHNILYIPAFSVAEFFLCEGGVLNRDSTGRLFGE